MASGWRGRVLRIRGNFFGGELAPPPTSLFDKPKARLFRRAFGYLRRVRHSTKGSAIIAMHAHSCNAILMTERTPVTCMTPVMEPRSPDIPLTSFIAYCD